MAAPHENKLPAAGGEGLSAAQELHLQVYNRCIIRHLRVLDAKIAKLELQLNDMLSKPNDASSSSGLLEDIVSNTMSKGSSCSELLDEIERIRTKRERNYGELQKNEQQIQGSDNGGEGNAGSGASPPAAGAIK